MPGVISELKDMDAKNDPYLKNLRNTLTKPPIHSRLVFLQDKSGKTRIVAEVDSYTQTVVKEIHHYLQRCCFKIPMDYSMRQANGRKYVLELTSGKGLWLNSYDLKNATDRFPAAFIKELLINFLGEEVAELWYIVMTQRTFHYTISKQNYVQKNGE